MWATKPKNDINKFNVLIRNCFLRLISFALKTIFLRHDCHQCNKDNNQKPSI